MLQHLLKLLPEAKLLLMMMRLWMPRHRVLLHLCRVHLHHDGGSRGRPRAASSTRRGGCGPDRGCSKLGADVRGGAQKARSPTLLLLLLLLVVYRC